MANGNPRVFDITIHSRPDGKYVVTPNNIHGKDYMNTWQEFDHTIGNAVLTQDDLATLYKSGIRIKWRKH